METFLIAWKDAAASILGAMRTECLHRKLRVRASSEMETQEEEDGPRQSKFMQVGGDSCSERGAAVPAGLLMGV